MDREKLEKVLSDGLADLAVELHSQQREQLLDYLDLLQRWNRAYNLTAVSEPLAMVAYHLLDSLAILPHLRGHRFIDVGTGPGLPGIPLAIALPDREFTLLDSNGKRVRFLFQVRTSLGLRNVHELHSRVEDLPAGSGFDGVISRAFTSLGQMVDSTGHLLNQHGVCYAMKGRYPEKELSELPKPYTVTACHRLRVPGVDGERHLLEIGNSHTGK